MENNKSGSKSIWLELVGGLLGLGGKWLDNQHKGSGYDPTLSLQIAGLQSGLNNLNNKNNNSIPPAVLYGFLGVGLLIVTVLAFGLLRSNKK